MFPGRPGMTTSRTASACAIEVLQPPSTPPTVREVTAWSVRPRRARTGSTAAWSCKVPAYVECTDDLVEVHYHRNSSASRTRRPHAIERVPATTRSSSWRSTPSARLARSRRRRWRTSPTPTSTRSPPNYRPADSWCRQGERRTRPAAFPSADRSQTRSSATPATTVDDERGRPVCEERLAGVIEAARFIAPSNNEAGLPRCCAPPWVSASCAGFLFR